MVKKTIAVLCATIIGVQLTTAGVKASAAEINNAGIENVKNSLDNVLYSGQKSDYKYDICLNEKTGEKVAVITGYTGTDGVFNVPGEIDGYKVVQIGHGDRIEGHNNVRNLILNGNWEDKSIDDYAFANSKNLESIVYQGTLFVGASSFEGCMSLKTIEKVDSQSGIATVKTNGFRHCENLSGTVDLSGSCCSSAGIMVLKSINIFPDAFNGCKNVDKFIFPEDSLGYKQGPSVIGAYAFSGTKAEVKLSLYKENSKFHILNHAFDNSNITVEYK